MKRTDWLSGIRSVLVSAPRRSRSKTREPVGICRRPGFEPLESRRLLAVDFGDAPDLAAGAGAGNYQTLATDNGPQHTVVVGLKMGASVDSEGGTLQNVAANADDVNGALPDDEDGLKNSRWIAPRSVPPKSSPIATTSSAARRRPSATWTAMA